jgi:L-rhamnose-H+ transport protein
MAPDHFLLGFVIVFAAGAVQGAFPLPMKYARAWHWENIWLVYSVFGLVIFPWLIAAWTVPDIRGILGSAPRGAVTVPFWFGAGWGVGGLLFGLGVYRVGLSLTLGIVIGLTSAIGSLMPLLLLHPSRIVDTGLFVATSVIVTLLGLWLCTAAGLKRERTAGADQSFRHGSFWVGIAVCVASGVLSPMFNFALIYGEPISSAAAARGAAEFNAPNLILAIAMTGGLIPTALYCGFLLWRNRTWTLFTVPGQSFESLLAILMAAMFAFSNSAYGLGAARLGGLGPVVGWPVFMALQVVAGNVLGVVTGEWAGVSARTMLLLALGTIALTAAAFLIAPAGA